MTPEIEQWIATLGDTIPDRIKTLDDLLLHRLDDQMSVTDMEICAMARHELKRLHVQECIIDQS